MRAFLDLADRNGSLTEWIIVMIADTRNWEDYFKKAGQEKGTGFIKHTRLHLRSILQVYR